MNLVNGNAIFFYAEIMRFDSLGASIDRVEILNYDVRTNKIHILISVLSHWFSGYDTSTNENNNLNRSNWRS